MTTVYWTGGPPIAGHAELIFPISREWQNCCELMIASMRKNRNNPTSDLNTVGNTHQLDPMIINLQLL